ncbi:UDP-glycosyltransferase 73D1-like [Zea mays]|jgi:hypothetical protein|uniref:Glycosyltransferase N-terminal domain-containing protein n=1 Tax=Zea mays TaxID=4577 RepID=C0PD25_MAIZE|nr:UDP-glycosyltransferase 73D1-like [Zea mays]ACN32070.1 unknown [Zea mays]|eukprot:NP_001306638.1 UDP-glycosyltransferase 73D1-like [Zea mays]
MPHFVLVPMLAAGHAGPMLDMARALASRGALVTFVTTPLNLLRLGRAPGDGELPIRFLPLRFPCTEAGLPEGCESADALPGIDFLRNFHDACAMLRAPLVAHLREAHPPASGLVSDTCHPWTGAVARELGVPRLGLETFCAFSSFCMRQMSIHSVFEGISDHKRPVRVPGFPIHVEMSRARSPENFSGFGKVFADEVMAENARADGLVVNSFAELEPLFVDAYEAALGKKIWAVGPLFLQRNMPLSATSGSDDATAVRCGSWLEQKKPRSAVLVSFGSLARSSQPQLVEIAHGLEASNRPFIWVVKPASLAEFERWLSDDGFERRVGDRGLVVTGWAPQKAILSHPATGAFVTHCGWNSVLECVAAGLPMTTWPHFGDQFMNEKLVVDVLRVGVPVGVKDATQWGVETEGVVATREDVERALEAVMDGGVVGAARQARAAELGRKAWDAVARGGSSDRNMSLLVDFVEQMKATV